MFLCTDSLESAGYASATKRTVSLPFATQREGRKTFQRSVMAGEALGVASR